MGRLCVYCDGNVRSGLGHLSRCMALATIVRKFDSMVRVVFIGHYEQYALDRMQASAFDFIQLPIDVFNTAYVLEVLGFQEADFLLMDSYTLPQSFYNELSAKALKWGVLDDFELLDYSDAQLVINFRVGATEMFNYAARTRALGPQFFPVNLEFESIRRKNQGQQVEQKVEHILICLGGKDLFGVSLELLKTVALVFNLARITLLSSDESLVVTLNERYKGTELINIECLCTDVHKKMTNVDLIVSGGGLLKYEASYCAIPNATLSQTREQQQDTLVLEKEGVTLSLGLASQFDKEEVKVSLKRLSQKKRQIMREQQVLVYPVDVFQPLARVVLDQL